MTELKRKEYIFHIKSLLKLGVPIIIGQLGNIVTGLADTVMVGQHSTQELAAASFVNNVINAFIILGTGFSFNYTPIIGENIAANKVDQKVTLELANTGEVIYESGAIAPGSHVQTIQLDANLEPGVYDALATFDGYDIETHEKKGTAAAKVTLAVEP